MPASDTVFLLVRSPDARPGLPTGWQTSSWPVCPGKPHARAPAPGPMRHLIGAWPQVVTPKGRSGARSDRAGMPVHELSRAEGSMSRTPRPSSSASGKDGALDLGLDQVIGHLDGVDTAGGHEFSQVVRRQAASSGWLRSGDQPLVPGRLRASPGARARPPGCGSA